MASGLCSVVVWLVLCAILAPSVSADDDCLAYEDAFQKYNRYQECRNEFCCGSCRERYCCRFTSLRITEDRQLKCDLWTDHMHSSSAMSVSVAVSSVIVFLFIIITCCICPCCCLYKMCRKPQPVIATTTHTTVVTASPQHYPQQPTGMPSQPQSYQSTQYPPYQPIPVQPGYVAQPMPPAPYQGQSFTPGPPPTYQEAIGPSYPPNPMPYSQAAFSPSQPPYPLQPPAQPGANAPTPTHADFLTQPAYNPNYVTP
ncbi:protein shisa-4-like [Solea solea]|uniref:protein shisa-4-like n=1 Tax=Solea solea TaxID=90069 RepID=UPI00272D3637|nr:protein shisa-4-like [Solea solea]